MAKKFPDLNKDGKVTQADVLKGRGVFNGGGEADRYLQLYEQMQKSLVEARNDEKKKEEIRRRFQQSVVGFDDSAIANAMKMLDAQRNAMAEGSLMMPVEREAYGKGKLIKKALKALDGNDSPKEKIKTTEKGVKIDTEIQQEVRDFIGKLKTVDADDRKYFDDALTAKQLEDYLYDFINEVPEKGDRQPGLHRMGSAGYDLTSRFEFFGALDDAVESMVEANAGPVLDKKSRQKLQNRMFMEGKRELEAEEKAAKAERKQARKEKRAEARRAKENEGSLMMPTEREAYGKGKLIKEVSPKIIDLFERLVGPKTLAKKEKMVDEAQAQREIQRAVEKNPQILEQLSDEDYMETISLLPQKQQANFGMADAPLDDNMVDMLLDMDPEEVAKNLELFTSIDDMFEYAGSLDAKDARKFMNALSPEDKEIFAGELPEFELGPREVKGQGGFSGVSILIPAEYEETPEDAYNNISSKEEKEEVKNMNSDNEMEEEYLDYVADEVLSQEEQDYLFKTLDKDNKLEKILDKIMLNATEFTGSGEVDGPGSGISDSIPARLSDGEFVFTRKATDQIGADNLQTMMDDAEREFDQRNGKAKGGMPVNNRYSTQDNENQQQEVENQMLSSNRMPSLMKR